jgi:purine-binding chemotaxis protein CheW
LGLSLLCHVGHLLVALPITAVVETMRPLPIAPLDGAPRFVRGLSIIRGVPIPVVDAAALLGAPAAAAPTPPERFVALRAGDHRVALAVTRIAGVRELPDAELHALPPLLAHAHPEVVSAIGALDSQLVLVLQAARIVPESVWQALGAAGAAP